MKPNMISTCLALIGLLHPLVYTASAEGQYGPLQPPQCGYSNVTHAEVHNAVLAKRDGWPWIVGLGYNTTIFPGLTWICTGTLISSRHVLTTGACTLYYELTVVRIGALNLYDGDDDGVQAIDVEIEKIIVHPEFNLAEFKNNVAVLKLAKEVPISDHIRPICLPLRNDFESKNLSGSYTAGWGSFVDYLSRNNDLMEVQVRVVNNDVCRNAYSALKGVVDDNHMLCVTSINPAERHCKGHLGSPLMLSQGSAFYEIGFSSHGRVTINVESPCAYTRVSAYMDFITSALK